MPLFMLRSSPIWIVVASLGSIMPVARAEDPPCPSQITLGGATAGPATGAAATAAQQKRNTGGNIDVSSDQATLGVDGNATLRGNVEVRQGDREIHADQVDYDSNNSSMRSDGHIDYQDPLVHVAGAGGSYSASAGAEFRSAQFDLRQRAARGAAREMTLTPA